MTRPRSLVASLALVLATSSSMAWAADRQILPPFGGVQANAFALEMAAGSGLLGAVAFGIGEAARVSDTKPKQEFGWSKPVMGWAAAGAVGGAGTGLGLALFVDPQPSWIGAAGATVISLAIGTGGVLWLNNMASRAQPDDLSYGLLGLTLPIISALAGSVTYQGLRWLTTPQPVATPRPLETPWPAPTPPMRIYF